MKNAQIPKVETGSPKLAKRRGQVSASLYVPADPQHTESEENTTARPTRKPGVKVLSSSTPVDFIAGIFLRLYNSAILPEPHRRPAFPCCKNQRRTRRADDHENFLERLRLRPPVTMQAPPQPPPAADAEKDAKAYYGYLFEADKKPTKVLDALLRAIAGYISAEIGNRDERALTPDKLASFYKAVGGNYDSLFVDVPHPSISWIYASIGCQHSLLPTSNDFTPPSIPALTPRGFVRWQSIEILLGPEEHVPFIQNAIRLFPIVHPSTGLPFPFPLPQEAFPLVPDAEVSKWHDQCARELRQRATPTEEDIRPNLHPKPKVQGGYIHVRPSRVSRDSSYFERERPTRPPPPSRPVAYHHVSSAGYVPTPVRPELSRSPSHRARQFRAPEDTTTARGRRASFPPPRRIPSPSPVGSPPQTRYPEERERRHSHPRHAHRRGSMSEDASSSEDGGAPMVDRRRRRRSYAHEPPRPPVAVRYSSAAPPPPPSILEHRKSGERERDRDREAEHRKRKGFPSIPIDISGKLSAPFLLGKRGERTKERPARSSSRSGGSGNVRWKDLDVGAVKGLWGEASGGSVEDDVGL
ncbi:hypothetical protein B2J93_367 [Marssonina coronariae]|uniref:DUF7514 domain-containing protein n=1 Tax=Diplocarpon coronariae TaxID=2795749 RepID=A0A218Z842_9HELO|nr:hypothetical protein B2J93_367 [Marssonina coronariae]